MQLSNEKEKLKNALNYYRQFKDKEQTRIERERQEEQRRREEQWAQRHRIFRRVAIVAAILTIVALIWVYIDPLVIFSLLGLGVLVYCCGYAQATKFILGALGTIIGLYIGFWLFIWPIIRLFEFLSPF